MNNNHDEFYHLMREFKDGKELYESSALFNACFNGILAGGSIYHILEEVIKIHLELSEKWIEYQTLNTFPKVVINADEFRKNYANEHALCPVCLSDDHTSTLAAYILDCSNPHSYKDLNDCVCQVCGDKHVTHDRLPKALKN